MINVISLGAGVQSSTMGEMAAEGLITPMPTCGVFADTGWEPKHVYDWLAVLEKRLPFPIYRVGRGNLRLDILARIEGRPGRVVSAPFWVTNKDGEQGLARRQCTREYKIEPITKKLRELAGFKPRQRIKGVQVSLWIGISLDEAHRMKPNREPWIANRWPLIELHMARTNCLTLMMAKGLHPPKSACLGCPYTNDARLRELKVNSPAEWAETVAFDNALRDPGLPNFDGKAYIHRSMKPLEEVDLRTAEDAGQTDMFGNECEGMCGV